MLRNHNIQEGQILWCAYGYEIKLNSFYQVLELIGKNKMILQELNVVRSWVNNVSGYESPIKDDFIGEKIIGKFDNKFCLVKISYNKLANLWCGEPPYFNYMD